MFIPTVLNSMNVLSKEQSANELLKLNEESKEFGLVLSLQDAVRGLEDRGRSLLQLGRIELGMEVTKSIIRNFYNSSYILPEEYATALSEIHDIFYSIKNETEDTVGDNELIKIMKEYFEGPCGGSLELLRSKLTSFAEDLRKKMELPVIKKEE